MRRLTLAWLAASCAVTATAAVYDDARDGNWTASGTWAAAGGCYPGSPGGGADSATVDSAVVTIDTDLWPADVAGIAVGSAVGGGTLRFAAGLRSVYSAVAVNGNAALYADGGDGALCGAIDDGPCTGVLTKSGAAALNLEACDSGFTGGWDVRAGTLWVKADGALGRGTLRVNAGAVRIAADQGGNNRPVRAVLNGGTLATGDCTTSGWEVDFHGGTVLFDHGGVFNGGTCTVHDATLNFATYGGNRQAGTYNGDILGTGTIRCYRDPSYNGGPMRLGGDNRGFAGNITAGDGLEANHVEALAVGGTTFVTGGSLSFGVDNPRGSVVLDGGGLSNCGQGDRTLGTDLDIVLAGGRIADVAHTASFATRILALDCRITGDGGLRLTGGGAELRDGGTAEIRLGNPANDYAGGTAVEFCDPVFNDPYAGRGQVRIVADGALGAGTVTVLNSTLLAEAAGGSGGAVLSSLPAVEARGGRLHVCGTENAGNIHLYRGGAFSLETANGNDTRLTWGPSGNVHVHPGAILAENLPDHPNFDHWPVGGEIEGARKGEGFYVGALETPCGFNEHAITSPRRLSDYGQACRGIGSLDVNLRVKCELIDDIGLGISFHRQDLRHVIFEQARFTFAAAGGAKVIDLNGGGIHASGMYEIRGAANDFGAAEALNMNAAGELRITDSGGLPPGTTLNLNAGYLTLGTGDAIAGTVEVNAGAVFKSCVDLAGGTINVRPGGGVWADGAGRLNPAHLRFPDGGGQILLYEEIGANLPTDGSVSFVLCDRDIDSFAQGIYLSEETRLTCCLDAREPRIAADIRTVSTTDVGGRIAAVNGAPYNCIYVNGVVDFSGKTLLIGDTATFTAVTYSGDGMEAIRQDGTVVLNSALNANIGAIDVVAGWLSTDINMLGGAVDIHVGAAGGVRLPDHRAASVNLSGDGTVRMKEGDRTLTLFGTRGGEGEHVGTIAPGDGAGTMTLQGDLDFSGTTYGAGDCEYARVVIDVATHGGEAGDDHDQLAVTGTLGGTLDSAQLWIALPLPSWALSPDVLNGGDGPGVDMTVIAAGAVVAGAFADVLCTPDTDRHWRLDAEGAVTVDADAGVVVLHGQAFSWTGFGGDADLNGVVDYVDLGLLATHYGQTGAGWDQADFNFDGRVDYVDLGVLATCYGLTEGGGGSPLPAPSGLFLLGAGAVGLLLRRP